MIALASISEETLSLDAHVAAVAGPRAGAITTFIGTVRDHDPSVDGEVVGLDYSAHPSAAEVLGALAARHDAPDLVIAVTHRIGSLSVGEAAIVAAVSAPHRRKALDTVSALVETVKAELPVWKREVLADGSHVWVGL
ncbi:molybdenum cofactor biosynthesis protein MoaE [Demequina rhizosphaerae]|uniref:molybdenum cofactor biosynthesis protein MoaE n=1 Tax=Demequina rhizosphaerae TaxID=1638985 RepID=UPI0007859A60|nr:molybdenum cofactor biosynthesis protein MoaE [Demequina rhizosphaerae]